jgi:hypothetical protein
MIRDIYCGGFFEVFPGDIVVSNVETQKYLLIMKPRVPPYFLTLDLRDGTVQSIAFHKSVVEEIY